MRVTGDANQNTARSEEGTARTRLIQPQINVADGQSRENLNGDDAVTRFRRRPDDNRDRDGTRETFQRRPETRPDNRNRPDNRPDTRRRDYRPPRDNYYRYGFRDGYTYGYHRGYHRGYHIGHGHAHYQHRHYYGPHLVFGYHFGGFGFYHGRWHFALVVGSPYVHHHHHYYRYSWWDGRGATLISWQRAVQSYPSDYRFGSGSCVALWLRTVDGTDYQVKIDPRYWNARDPGELYAALWAELERDGQLQIEDINGAVHIFPAGMIQQIEATGCR